MFQIASTLLDPERPYREWCFIVLIHNRHLIWRRVLRVGLPHRDDGRTLLNRMCNGGRDGSSRNPSDKGRECVGGVENTDGDACVWLRVAFPVEHLRL
jgi:hypothetical protein